MSLKKGVFEGKEWKRLLIEGSEQEDEPVQIYYNCSIDNRCNLLKQFFRDSFQKTPSFIVSVPGRVNLIGEHIDYCGYGVLPMALEQSILVAVGENDEGKIVLVNKEKKFEKSMVGEIFSGCTTPQWYHYFQCGVQGALNHSESVQFKGMNVAVWGNIPPSAGLSSSSALVSAAALCTFHFNQLSPGKREMAELCAKAEHLIGTQGGGMDQAIAFLAKKGCAKHIEFSPLRSADVVLPEEAVFVIAHSMVEKNKAASNDFNIRVVECRLAAQVMAKTKGLDWRRIRKLKDVQDELDLSPVEILAVMESSLHDAVYEKSEIAKILSVTEEELVNISMTPNTKDVQLFELKKRARHVFRETKRVLKFKNYCQTLPQDKCIRKLGNLLRKSHESLKSLYECSHPQVDRLVEISEPFTMGCRLTGAGWGGCVVALTTADKVDEYLRALKEQFYSKLGVGDDDFGSYVFVTQPLSGACIYSFEICNT